MLPRLALFLLALAAAASPAAASSAYDTRASLARQTAQLRNDLMRSPQVQNARDAVAQARRDLHAARRAVIAAVENDPAWGRAQRTVWQFEHELHDNLGWAKPFNPWRVNAALRLMEARSELSRLRNEALAADPTFQAAKQADLDARRAWAEALAEVDRRVRDDGRLKSLRKQYRTSLVGR
jgi:hypothetical protein